MAQHLRDDPAFLQAQAPGSVYQYSVYFVGDFCHGPQCSLLFFKQGLNRFYQPNTISMNQNVTDDKQVVLAQLFFFIFAGFFGFSGDLWPGEITLILYKLADALFITGCIILAMMMARKGWDLPATGYTVLSIAWGVFFLAKDFRGQEIGNDIFASAFYFLLPSMILITFYKPFPFIINILTLVTIIPSLLVLLSLKTEILLSYDDIIRKIGYQIIHFVSLVWGIYFYLSYRKEFRQPV